MATVILIPARSGSKSIPEKNIKEFCGKPLMAHVILAGIKTSYKTYVAVDSEKFASVARAWGGEPWFRPKYTATDKASTEIVAAEFVDALRLQDDDILVILQPTSPYTTSEDIKNVVNMIYDKGYNSVLSVFRKHVFTWEERSYKGVRKGLKIGIPFTYSPSMRPRRQDWEGQLLENGAIYATWVGGLRATYSRISGCVGLYRMDYGFEIDTPLDWAAGEAIMEGTWIQQQ